MHATKWEKYGTNFEASYRKNYRRQRGTDVRCPSPRCLQVLLKDRRFKIACGESQREWMAGTLLSNDGTNASIQGISRPTKSLLISGRKSSDAAFKSDLSQFAA